MWQSDKYSVFSDSVVQQGFLAKALSPFEIISNYNPEVFYSLPPEINFKFSINGKDNELISGIHHHFKCLPSNNTCETPIIKFGEPYHDEKDVPAGFYLNPGTKCIIRVDLREIFEGFAKHGNYRTFDGDHIYKDDFRSIHIVGDLLPLTWDFNNLANHPELELKDPNGDHIYEVSFYINGPDPKSHPFSSWKLQKDISSFPKFESDFILSDALYNLSLEEMLKDIEPDGTFRTGEEWPGVWTRDISYSIILSMAMLQPEISKNSLMRKVVNGRIVQDTGTGGAYPVSTDRMIWAVAAWEIYKVTGEKEWLDTIYPIVRNSAEDDLHNILDKETGLFKGESSFLDWREQTYPDWMQPADIFESVCLGTNAVHYKAYHVLSQMARQLEDHEAYEKYLGISHSIKEGINKYLWVDSKNRHGQYLYGKNYKLLSPRSETLGEALCILFDISEKEKHEAIVENMPVVPFGMPCIFPQIPDIAPYHNNGIWPFVQAYWTLATAKVQNEFALVDGICALYRATALFLTNKENFVAENGDYAGTVINSNNMLWSLSGNLGLVYRVFFGVNFRLNHLTFSPNIPQIFRGTRRLKNFKYRNANLDIEIEGFGNQIKEFWLDNQLMDDHSVPGHFEGNHQVVIRMNNSVSEIGKINKMANRFSLPAPKVRLHSGVLRWMPLNGAVKSNIYINGVLMGQTHLNEIEVSQSGFAEFQISALDDENQESFVSEPISIIPEHASFNIGMERFVEEEPLCHHHGYCGEGYIEVSKNKNTCLDMEVHIPQTGLYAIDFKYSNGNGPVNTESMCAMRTLELNKKPLGTVVFPQRGAGNWSDWGFSNSVKIFLNQGNSAFALVLDPANENMDVQINHAFLDFMRFIKIS